MKLIADHLTYEYNKGEVGSVKALDDVSFVINNEDFIGIIGHTGSGKSTLVQVLNGLLKPSSGTVYFDGEDVFEKGYDRKKLRSKVGIVFQYPEHQLFAENVFEDVCFGPRNMGVSKKDTQLRAYDALKTVGLEDEYFYQSPFDLSGGQKRRVAIAGVLAMKPEILILDEPTAGLDPKGRTEILDTIKHMHEKDGITIIIVSHSMDDVAEYVNRVIVMNKGKVEYDDKTVAVFENVKRLEEMGLAVPEVTYFIKELNETGLFECENAITVDQARENIIKCLLKEK